MARLESADAKTLAPETALALKLLAHGAGRETGALRSIEDVFSGSEAARKLLDRKARQWQFYETALRGQVIAYAGWRAAQLGVPAPGESPPDELERKCQRIIPAIAPSVKGRQFTLAASEQYSRYMKEHPDAIKQLGVSSRQQTAILNYVNGKRSIARIAVCVAGELDEDVPIQGVLGYVELLEAAGWLVSSKL